MMGQARELIQTMKNPGESEHIRALAGALAEMERTQRQHVRELYRAMDAPDEAMPPKAPDETERIEELCTLVGARLNDTLDEFWAEHQAERIDSAERAAQYLGTAGAEWEQMVATWSKAYREQDDGLEAVTDRELADDYTQRRFGIGLEEFERRVVTTTEADILERALRGPFATTDRAIVEAIDVVRETNEEDEVTPADRRVEDES